MEKKLSLTDAEWSVMEQLWAAPGSTGRALTAALEQKTGWSRSTTLTLLRRLAEKGAGGGICQAVRIPAASVPFSPISPANMPLFGRRVTCWGGSTTEV